MADTARAQYLGGSGVGDAFGRYTTQSVLFIGSTAQAFTVGDAPTAIAAIQVVQDLSAAGSGITAANDIRVKIPARLDMAWDPSVTTATITGGASAKVSTTVSYANSNKTLIVNVTSDFADNEVIYVSGLNFKSFNTAGRDYLTLEVDNLGNDAAADAVSKTIVVPAISGNTSGGRGDGHAVYAYTTQQGQMFHGSDF